MRLNSILALVLVLLTANQTWPKQPKDLIQDLWFSDKVNSSVGQFLMTLNDRRAINSDCTNHFSTKSECREFGDFLVAKSLAKIFRNKKADGDVVLVKILMFADTGLSSDFQSEVLERGKRMLPAIDFAIRRPPYCREEQERCIGTESYIEMLEALKDSIKK